MKNIVLIFVLFLLSVRAQTQINLRLEYFDFTTTSRNLGISVAKNYGRNQFGVGVKYHFNDPLKPLESVYLRNLISKNVSQNIGFFIDYRRYFSKNDKLFNFYFFAHEQFTRKTKKDITVVTYVPSLLQKIDTITRGPLSYLENIVGFGVNLKLSTKLKLMTQIGGGVTLINVTDNGRYITWEFVGLLSAGIAYSIRSPNEFRKIKRSAK